MPDFTTIVDVPVHDFTQYWFIGSILFGDHWCRHGSNQYLFLCSMYDVVVHALKSTDGGLTWVDVGSVAIATHSGDAGPHFTVGIDGDTAYLFWPRIHSTSVGLGISWAVDGTSLKKFDMTSDSWGPEIQYSPSQLPLDSSFQTAVIASGLNAQYFIRFIVRAPGDYVLLFCSTRVTDTSGVHSNPRLSYIPFDGTTLGTSQQLPGQTDSSKYYMGIGGVYDGTLTHFLSQSNQTIGLGDSLLHWTLSAAGTMVGPQIVTSNLYGDHLTGQTSDPWIAGTKIVCAAYTMDGSGPTATQSIRAYYAALSDTSTWTNVVITNDQDLLPNAPALFSIGRMVTIGSNSGALLCYADYGSDFIFWARVTTIPTPDLICAWVRHGIDDDTWGSAYYSKSTDDGVTWSAPAVMFPDLSSHSGEMVHPSHGMQALQLEIASRAASSVPEGMGIDCNDPPDGALGDAYSHPLTITGAPAGSTVSITGGALPAGLTIDDTGLISGTPTLAGSYTYTATVATPSSGSASVTCTMNVGYGDLSTSCGAPPAYTVGVAGARYRPPVIAGAIGLPPVYDQDGTLVWTFPVSPPPGLHWETNPASPDYGYLVGTPTMSGVQGFTYTVSTPDGQSITNTCPLDVAPADDGGGGGGGGEGGGINITCANPPGGKVGVPYSHTFPVTGATGPTRYSVVVGALPPGVHLDPATGDLSGTPTAPGTYSFSIKVQQ